MVPSDCEGQGMSLKLIAGVRRLGALHVLVCLPIGFSLREHMLFPMYVQGHIREFQLEGTKLQY